LTQPIHGRVQAVFEIDERTVVPEPLVKCFWRDDNPGLLDERDENLQRLALQSKTSAVLSQFSRGLIEGERSEDALGRPERTGHPLGAHDGVLYQM
jgi:hypothetical protein